ncbi:MAG: SAM-dependent methyltransferase, partial [Haloferula sp.]
SKFQESPFQTALVGMLDPSAKDPFYRKMAMGLRGRIKQLLGERGDELCQAESQLPDTPTLFCMIGDSGLFAGIATPREANGFYPGGSKFISHKAPHMISRAGAKVAEALHYIQLDQPPPGTGAHWLELGACPGGMTSELLQRSYKVTAVDRAPLDPRLDGKSGLKFVKADVADFAPAEETHFDAMLCDMNGESGFALKHVIRLSQWLEADGLVIFTLKTAGINGYSSLVHHFQQAVAQARSGGLALITNTHLTTNRHEFTLFFSKAGSKPSTD